MCQPGTKGVAGSTLRTQQAKEFTSDWSKWSGTLKDYDPQLKNFEDLVAGGLKTTQ